MLGGRIQGPERQCEHGPTTFVPRWIAEPGTAGTVAVVGAGKMGLPLAAQFASHGWRVVAVDTDRRVVDAVNDGQSHVVGEPGLDERVAQAHADGRLSATSNGAEAAREADVVILIVPVMLNDQRQPDYGSMDSAVASVAEDLRPGVTVIFETTLPVGDTRQRYAPMLEQSSGLNCEVDLFIAFSPERLYAGSIFQNLATYPKLVGGVGPHSSARAAHFYASVLDTEVVEMSSSEAAELSKLAETTYRDVNIAFANQLAAYADRVNVDVYEVVDAANSQPYSHIHQPGLGVGGHCIPVYPHFILSREPGFELIAASRRINDGQVDAALTKLGNELGPLGGAGILVLGLTYRAGVKELAYSRALPLITRLKEADAWTLAWDPLLTEEEIERTGATAWTWGTRARVRAIVVQTADATFRNLDLAWFPDLQVVLDGRNSLRDVAFPPHVRVIGIGTPTRGAPSDRESSGPPI